MPSVCIICHEEKSGQAVADTTVIRAIRTVKERLGMATGNVLVVCPDCSDNYAKRRKKYEGKMITYSLLGAVVFLIIVLLPLLNGSFSLGTALFGLLFGAFVASLSLLDYVPPMARTPDEVPASPGLPAPPPVPAIVVPLNWLSASKVQTPAKMTQPAGSAPARPTSKPPTFSPRAKPKSAARKTKSASKVKSASKSKAPKGRRR